MFASGNHSGKEKNKPMLKKNGGIRNDCGPRGDTGADRRSAAEGSVEILTRTATAYGDRATDLEGNSSIFRPTYPLEMRVVCPAKRDAGITVDPVNAHTIPGVKFTCTGTPQAVRFTGTGAPSWEQGWHSGDSDGVPLPRQEGRRHDLDDRVGRAAGAGQHAVHAGAGADGDNYTAAAAGHFAEATTAGRSFDQPSFGAPGSARCEGATCGEAVLATTGEHGRDEDSGLPGEGRTSAAEHDRPPAHRPWAEEEPELLDVRQGVQPGGSQPLGPRPGEHTSLTQLSCRHHWYAVQASRAPTAWSGRP